MNATSPLGPLARLVRDGRQRADDPVVMDERRDELAGELEDARRSARSHASGPRARRRGTPDPAGAQDLADPALVAVEDGEAGRDLVGEAGPGRDIEPVVAEDPDGRGCPRGGRACVSSTIVRNSSWRSCEAASRSAMPSTVSRRSASSTSSGRALAAGSAASGSPCARSRPPEERRPAAALGRVGPSGPGQPGFALVVGLTHAHVPMVAPRGRSIGTPAVRTWPVRTYRVPADTGLVDRPGRPGLHSARADSRNAAEPAVPSRTQEVSAPSWTTVPVDATPPEASSPGTRSAPLPDG